MKNSHLALSPHLAASLLACASMLAAACDTEPRPQEVDGPEPHEPIAEGHQPLTAGEAVQQSCSTASVDGLSRQIIEQGNCIVPGAFVELPDLPNVSYLDGVYRFLEEPARDAFVEAAQSTGMTITMNSMLRSVAQQYLLYAWYQQGRCGIPLAATPGASNHESGLAFDTNQYSAWRSHLEAHGFRWYGSNDVYHFDYVGPGAVDYRGTDVQAFQVLWNRNHPDDLIDEDGSWGPQTSQRMSMSPAEGFPLGADCDVVPGGGAQLEPAISIAGVSDVFDDGASAAVADVFEDERHELSIRLTNAGDEVASAIVLAVEIDDPWLQASSYLIESDYQTPGEFTENDANAAPENPSHTEVLPRRFDLVMYGISPGETKRVTLDLDVGGASVQQPTQPGVRAWVKHIDAIYDQADYGGEVTGDGSQVFNEGRLELATPIDVYARSRWEFETNRREGWTSPDLADVSVANGALVGVDTVVRSPALDTGGDAITLTRIRARREGGSGDAWLHVLADATGDLDDGTAIAIDLPDDGAFHEVDVDTSGVAGVPAAIAIEPFDGGGGTLELDWARIELGEPGGDGDAGDGDGDGDGDAGDGDGDAEEDAEGDGDFVDGAESEPSGPCGCRVAGAPTRSSAALALLVAGGAVTLARRRRR